MFEYLKSISKIKPNEKTQQLRNKIVIVSIGIMLCMFIFVIVLTRTMIDVYNNKNADEEIQMIMNMTDVADSAPTLPYIAPYFVVTEQLDELTVDLSQAQNLGKDTALEIYKKAMVRYKEKGTCDAYRYQMNIRKDKTTAVFLYIGQANESKNIATGILLIILLISLVILSVVASICSNFIIAPFLEQTEQQKQFIADASHDLKTPLSVIMANIDVIEMSSGQTKWTKNVKKELKRMADLIDDMLTLSKLENFTERSTPISVNISDILNEMVTEFDPMWKDRNITVVNRVNDNLITQGSPQQITRLFRTIMQNATKYCTENGRFELVAKRNKGRLLVSMYNTAELDETTDYNKMFERFYRSDSSRNSKTGGHGIGLSIAKKICELENYQIRAEKQKDGITFIMIL